MSHLTAYNVRSKRTYRCDSMTLCAGARDVAYLTKIAERLNAHNTSGFVFGVAVVGVDHSFSIAAHKASLNADHLATRAGVKQPEFD